MYYYRGPYLKDFYDVKCTALFITTSNNYKLKHMQNIKICMKNKYAKNELNY